MITEKLLNEFKAGLDITVCFFSGLYLGLGLPIRPQTHRQRRWSWSKLQWKIWKQEGNQRSSCLCKTFQCPFWTHQQRPHHPIVEVAKKETKGAGKMMLSFKKDDFTTNYLFPRGGTPGHILDNLNNLKIPRTWAWALLKVKTVWWDIRFRVHRSSKIDALA